MFKLKKNCHGAYGRNFGSKGKIQNVEDECDTLQAAMGNGGGNVPILKQVGILDIKGIDQIKRVYSDEGLSPTLTNMQGGNRQPKIVQRTPLKFLNRNQKNIEGDYAFCVDNSNTGGIKEISNNEIRIRKLTPKECWRLMGFSDEDFEKAAFTKDVVYIEGGIQKCNAKLKVVKEKQRHTDMETYVLCTTKDETEQECQEKIMKTFCISKEQIEKIQNVNIAIELLEDVELKECATNTIKCGDYMEMLYMLIKNLEQHHMAIIELEKEDNMSIGKYMRITSEENLNLMKSYIISILIKQIIVSKICGYTNQKMNIQGNIAIITDCKKNLMKMKLSNLKMEFITRLNSNTTLYKQAGNSIVVNVLEKIFTNLFIGE